MPYPAGATTVAKGNVDVHRLAITSAFATVPGLADGGASFDLRELEGKFRDRQWNTEDLALPRRGEDFD